MTAEQAFNVAMNMYPSLYGGDSLLSAKFKYYDHIFNTIGNGYRDMKEFKDSHTITSKNIHLTQSFPEKYITGEPLFYAYTEVKERHGYNIGKQSSSLPGLYTKEELNSMSQVKHAMQTNANYFDEIIIFNPYPNFDKDYSFVWEDISKLDKSWPESALVFYQKCQEYFASDKVSNYHYACPKDIEIEKWKESIEIFEENFAKYKTEGITQSEYNQKISKAYEIEYNGDTKDFIKRRWEKEHARINEFLNETVERLEAMLTPEITPKTKKKSI